MESIGTFDYLLTAESKWLEAKEEATVALHPSKIWID
jgi:hypothetical protein